MERASSPVASTQVLRLIIVVLVPWYFSAVVQCLSLAIDRVTANSMLVDITCEKCDGDSFMWEYKTSPEGSWGLPPRLFDHLFNQKAYYVSGLKENTLHYVRVRHNSTGAYSNTVEGWTCETLPPPVEQLRVAAAGPGWFDIRWTRPKEKCKSFYYYYVRYRPVGGSYTPTKRYGYFDVTHSRAYVKPSHPCSGEDFCVLLTDHVVAGHNHQIELQVERIGGGDDEKSEKLELTGIANTENTGLVDVKTCPERTKSSDNGIYEEDNQDRIAVEMANVNGVILPLWVAILLGIFFLLTLSTIVGLWVKFSIMNAPAEEKKTDEITLPPAEYMEERYVDSRELALSANWKKTSEYDDQEPEYEEINIHLSTQPASNSSTAAFPSKQCE